MYYTYLYVDPKTNIPRYVGKGKDKRAWKHFKKSECQQLFELLSERIKEGYKIEPIIHYEENEETALQMEDFWVELFGRTNVGTGTLFNKAAGGKQPPLFKDKKRDPSFGEKISKTNKGRPGKPMSEEAKKKLSIINTGRDMPWMTDEWRVAQSARVKEIWRKRKESK